MLRRSLTIARAALAQQIVPQLTGRAGTRLRAVAPMAVSSRALSLHEHYSYELLSQFGVPVPKFAVVKEAGGGVQACDELGENEVIVKSQVLAGGRGLGTFTNGFHGGVHLADRGNVDEFVNKMLGENLVTKQTGAEGLPVTRLMVAERLQLIDENYFAILMDREHKGPVLVASTDGGVDIEGVAAATPERIHTVPVDINEGPSEAMLMDLAATIGFSGDQQAQAADIMGKLYELFLEKDCTLVEINPFATERDGRVLCVDAKLNFDDNAEFRQAEVFDKRDLDQEDPREVAAGKFDLSYVGLDGNVGCLVNGAGLAMATMDIIKLYGGEPANFLDVGGGATEEQVKEAFKILTTDANVSAILVNIFGGIMRCDVIARGIIAAANELKLSIPVIVRLEGTNVAEGKQLLNESGLDLVAVDDLDQAAQTAVKMATDLASSS